MMSDRVPQRSLRREGSCRRLHRVIDDHLFVGSTPIYLDRVVRVRQTRGQAQGWPSAKSRMIGASTQSSRSFSLFLLFFVLFLTPDGASTRCRWERAQNTVLSPTTTRPAAIASCQRPTAGSCLCTYQKCRVYKYKSNYSVGLAGSEYQGPTNRLPLSATPKLTFLTLWRSGLCCGPKRLARVRIEASVASRASITSRSRHR